MYLEFLVKYFAVPLHSYWILSLNIYHSLLSQENLVTVNLGITGALYDALKIFLQSWIFFYFEQSCFKTKEDQVRCMILNTKTVIITIYIFDHIHIEHWNTNMKVHHLMK